MPIDLSVVGKRLEPTTHTYTERDVMLYALGVGADEEGGHILVQARTEERGELMISNAAATVGP